MASETIGEGLVHFSGQEAASVPTSGRPTSVAAILNAAADLLEKPGAWTQGDYARDALGVGFGEFEHDPDDFEPVCFCTIGAVNHARGESPDRVLWGDLRRQIWDVLGEVSIADWNDAPGRTQEEVVAALREAARKADAATAPDKLAGYEAEGRMNPTPTTIQEER